MGNECFNLLLVFNSFISQQTGNGTEGPLLWDNFLWMY
jgi:hypothetical protein